MGALRDEQSVFSEEELMAVLRWAGFKQARGGWNSGRVHGACPVHPGADNPHGFSAFFDGHKHGAFVCWTRKCLASAKTNGTDVFGFVAAVLDEREAADQGVSRSDLTHTTSFSDAKAVVEEIIGREIAVGKRERMDYHAYFRAQVENLSERRHVELRVLAERELENYRNFHPYLLNRGFTRQVMEAFEIGYDPKCDRITIPMRGIDGQIVAIAKRVVDDKKVSKANPKYRHDSFAKSEFLYNLHRVKEIILNDGGLTKLIHPGIIVVEGQPDVWRLFQYGFPLAVAVGGSSLTIHQGKLLAQFTDQVTIILDSDKAGQNLVKSAKEVLGKFVTVYVATVPRPYKDVGEIVGEHGIDLVHYILESRKKA